MLFIVRSYLTMLWIGLLVIFEFTGSWNVEFTRSFYFIRHCVNNTDPIRYSTKPVQDPSKRPTKHKVPREATRKEAIKDVDGFYLGTLEDRKKDIFNERGIAQTWRMPYHVEKENDLVYWMREHYGYVIVSHITLRGQRILIVLGGGNTSSGPDTTVHVYGWHEKVWDIDWIGFVAGAEVSVKRDKNDLFMINNKTGKTLFRASASTL